MTCAPVGVLLVVLRVSTVWLLGAIVGGEKFTTAPDGSKPVASWINPLKPLLGIASIKTPVEPPWTAWTLEGFTVRLKSWLVVTVKFRLALPRDNEVTVSGPLVAAVGTVVVIVPAVIVRTTAEVPLNVTRVAPGSKLLPEIVTRVPITPRGGSTSVMLKPSIVAVVCETAEAPKESVIVSVTV